MMALIFASGQMEAGMTLVHLYDWIRQARYAITDRSLTGTDRNAATMFALHPLSGAAIVTHPLAHVCET
ncbi:MAG: hypothetical protein JO076_14660 [Verrucomicrobia bacterium]|nr:hypothetical protein [Verrucomicrobiota bacterium]